MVDAFSRKNKIETWTLYTKAIESGVAPEAIIGMFFWNNTSIRFSLSTL